MALSQDAGCKKVCLFLRKVELTAAVMSLHGTRKFFLIIEVSFLVQVKNQFVGERPCAGIRLRRPGTNELVQPTDRTDYRSSIIG